MHRREQKEESVSWEAEQAGHCYPEPLHLTKGNIGSTCSQPCQSENKRPFSAFQIKFHFPHSSLTAVSTTAQCKAKSWNTGHVLVPESLRLALSYIYEVNTLTLTETIPSSRHWPWLRITKTFQYQHLQTISSKCGDKMASGSPHFDSKCSGEKNPRLCLHERSDRLVKE